MSDERLVVLKGSVVGAVMGILVIALPGCATEPPPDETASSKAALVDDAYTCAGDRDACYGQIREECGGDPGCIRARGSSCDGDWQYCLETLE